MSKFTASLHPITSLRRDDNMSRNDDNTNYDLTPAASQLTSHDSISTPTRTVRQSSGLSRIINIFLQNPYLLTLLIWGKIFGTLPISQHFSSKSLSFNLTDLGRHLNHTPTTCVSRRIDTWQIVYPSYKDPCPTISIHKSAQD